MKYCRKCDTEKSGTNFYNNKSKKDGLSSWCKQCNDETSKQRNKKWKEDNHIIMKEYQHKYYKKYYKKNKNKILKKVKEYRINNITKIKQWRDNNKEKIREYNRLYSKKTISFKS